jgi:hypothetical protein
MSAGGSAGGLTGCVDYVTGVMFTRVLPLAVWVLPSYLCIKVLSYPLPSYCMVLFACGATAIASWRSFGSASFKFCVWPLRSRARTHNTRWDRRQMDRHSG